jgi:5-methylcytosine-specific restriction endonuclease McrA
MTKVCTKCKTEKPLDDFYIDKRGKHGRYSRCKPCFYEVTEERRHKSEAADPEKWREYRRQKRALLTPEKKSEYNRRWREQNPEKVSKSIKAAKAKKPDLYRSHIKRWEAENREKVLEIQFYAQRRHRALKMGAQICDFTHEDWQDLKRQYQGCCAYCGEKPKILTQDHVIPLAKGGNHTKANIVPACQPCNSRKNVNPAPPIHPKFASTLDSG